MKLELHHITPYADKAVFGTFNGVRDILTDIDFVNGLVSSLNNGSVELENFKLELRPLSDLNRYGEDIINEHSINLLISEKYNLDYGTFSSFKGELDIELDGDPDLRYDVNKRISFDVMLTIQEELLKGHYDIYGLIENNLAIDINTVK